MFTALIVIIGLSVLILGHEAGHFFAAKAFGMKVDEFGFGFPPRIAAFRKGETEYSINWLPFGGFVKIAGETNPEDDAAPGESIAVSERARLFVHQAGWKRAVVLVAGVCVNFIVGWLLLSSILMIGSPSAVVVTSIENNSPAAAAGIAAGDVVRGYYTGNVVPQGAQSVGQSKDLIAFINAHRGTEIMVTVLRDGREKTIAVTPRTNPGEPGLGILLGDGGAPKMGFWSALKEGFMETLLLAWLMIVTFVKLIAGLFLKASLLPGIVGPVGIFGVAREVSKIGFVYLLELIAQISISLAMFNLFPIPLLDGGQLLFLGIEKAKGSRISKRAQEIASIAAMVLIAIIFVSVTVRDILHL